MPAAPDVASSPWPAPHEMLSWGMDDDAQRAHHDIGGIRRFMCEAVDIEPHALTAFDREVDAIRQILGRKGVMSVDELRRGIESIPEADYHRLSYYERWIRSIADTLLRKGVISAHDLEAALARHAGSGA